MFEIQKSFQFEAGHQLKYHDGVCQRPHGHSYVLTVCLRGEKLISSGPKTHMIIDFCDISNLVKPMIHEYFDHHWLNETLKTDSPTSEYIAKWIFDYLNPKLPQLYSITISETESSRVIYTNSC